jgi:glycoprotein-N-acetylgalactosamine 3-beta-galactosyltransferase
MYNFYGDVNNNNECSTDPSKCFYNEGKIVIDKIQVKKEDNEIPTIKNNLLCVTYTYEPNHNNIKSIIQTWGSRCDGYIAISNKTDEENSILQVDTLENRIEESYHHMWKKTKVIIMMLATSQLINEYDYFYIGGDDVYMIVENMKYYLNKSQFVNANKFIPLYLGRELRQNNYINFNSGGAGYVLNRASIRILYRMLMLENSPCLPNVLSAMEDVLVAHCLLQLKIKPYPFNYVVGSDGRNIFHPLDPHDSYFSPATRLKHGWLPEMARAYNTEDRCCSTESITFHYIKSPKHMQCLDYYVYNRSFV